MATTKNRQKRNVKKKKGLKEIENRNYIKYYKELIDSDVFVANKEIKTILGQLCYDIDNPRPGYFYDNNEALKAIKFVENYCHRKEDKTKKVETMIFQRFILSAVFGFRKIVEDEDYTYRRFKYVSYLVARKNGKSFLSACIILYVFLTETYVQCREFYSVSNSLEQSKVIWEDVKFLIDANDSLRGRFELKKARNMLICKKDNSVFKPLSSDTNAADGKRADVIVFDELHQFQDTKNGGIFNLLRDSNSASPNPLMFVCSTFGFLRDTVFDLEYNFMKRIIDKIDRKEEELSDTEYCVLPVVYKLDKETEVTELKQEDLKDIYKIRCLQKANPALLFNSDEKKIEGKKEGIKILQNLIDKMSQYIDSSSAELRNLLVKDCNIVSSARQCFLSYQEIENKEIFDIVAHNKNPDTKKSDKFRYFFAGIDLTRSNDLASVVFMFKRKNDDKFYIIPKFYLPAKSLENKIKEGKYPYEKWTQQGLIKECGEDIIELQDLVDDIMLIQRETKCILSGIEYDAWSSIDLINKIKEKFGTVAKPLNMNKKCLTAPYLRLEVLLVGKKLVYNDNQVLKWNFLNTQTEFSKDGKFMQPVKSTVEEKIDGTIGCICAINAYMNSDIKHLIE